MDIEEKTTAISISEHSQKIGNLAATLGYEGALTVGALEDEIRFYQRRSVEDVLELGKRLLLLKEMTPHGEFSNRIQLLGFSVRLSQKFMQAARKFCKSENFSHLKNLTSINQGKFLELVVLDDDEIQELAENGSVLDIHLDDIDCMTASELRKKLREIKADNEAKDQLLNKKDQKLNELDAKVTKLQSPVEIKKRAETEEQALEKAALETLNTASITFLNALMRYQNEVNSVLDTAEKKGISQLFERVDEAVIATYQRIAQYSQSLNVQVDFQNMLTPDWMFLQAADLPPIKVDGEA
ncbi:hypothetical protein C6378_01595 [Acinetobacter pittii]|uniref:hypothetical protein n=1 Tax=Acinetobacter pittii TaxID=48296 RepID=UPI0013740954|nr:hypothetical protein [Acinetobacter pittii]MBQ5174095.1 hypothetical protein [Acinetobacter pittii]QHQ32112.1 hypothetical protein EPY81_12205 [Acinetobacter pittii]USQ61782.1 hypothetical protein C7A15_13510 [Acinetobacter pittii]UTD34375.1 hypothetical protein DDE02_11445 [Acinetobacter pittii]